jgi:hypothetical protein
MKTQLIQNVFKMMIGTSALIASTAFFINTISPVQAGENNVAVNSELPTKTEQTKGVAVGCGNSIYFSTTGYSGWSKVGP